MPRDEERLEVSDELEQRLAAVETAVASYLARADADAADALRTAVTHLDQLLEASDQFRGRRTLMGGRWAAALPMPLAIGATAPLELVDDVDAATFAAQVALVRAAKDELRDPTPTTLHDLGTAWDARRARPGDAAPARDG